MPRYKDGVRLTSDLESRARDEGERLADAECRSWQSKRTDADRRRRREKQMSQGLMKIVRLKRHGKVM